MHLKDTVYI